MKRQFWCAQLTSVALALMIAAPAGAQAPTSTAFQVQQLEPLPAPGLNVLNIGTSKVLSHLAPSVGLTLHYADDPLVLRQLSDDDEIVSKLVDHQLGADLSLALGLFDVASLGVVVPMTVSQSGADLTLTGRPNATVSSFTLGDVRVLPKVQLLKPDNDGGLGLHISVPLWLPTGDADNFASDDAFRLRPTLGIDYHSGGGFVVAANVGYTIRPEQPIHDYVSDDQINWGVALETPELADGLTLLGTIFGAVQTSDNRDPATLQGLATTNDPSDSSGNPIEFNAGARYRFSSDVMAMIGGGAGVNRQVGAPLWRAFLTVGYTPTNADGDEDGIMDSDDDCPDQPEDKDGLEDGNGCPDLDNDNDGIPDVDDGAADGSGFGACRDQGEDADGFEDTDGCPDPDNDNDGVADADDACPVDAEDIDGFEDSNGCPDTDNDKDGIEDAVDGADGACRDQAEDKDGFEDSDGCPDPDNDKDGINDDKDKCPLQPEVKNGVDDDDGCPDTSSDNVKIEGTKIRILKKVFFNRGKDTIKKKSYAILNEVAQVLTETPFITKIRVDGHTDSDGKDDKNLDLSKRRAASVLAYLTKKGIDPARLTSEGFGESAPIGDNRSPDGRALNRRVEFNILEVNGKPVAP